MTNPRLTENPLNSISELLLILERTNEHYDGDWFSRLLFRGQNNDGSLLPQIARKKPEVNTTDDERKMLDEFKRRSPLIVQEKLDDDWDWLAYAQHNGMATRLLDWSSSPLVALWFAVQSPYHLKDDAFLYALEYEEKDLVDDDDLESGPFDMSRTKVFRPALSNKRIVAQNGWFTCHYYSANKFISIDHNKAFGTKKLLKFRISAEKKTTILGQLDMLGVNAQSVYPDTSGLALQINWENRGIAIKGF